MSLGICVDIEKLISEYDDRQLAELKSIIKEIEESRRPKEYLNRYILWVLNGFPDGLTMKQIMLITKVSEGNLTFHLDCLSKSGDIFETDSKGVIRYRSLWAVARKEFEEAGA